MRVLVALLLASLASLASCGYDTSLRLPEEGETVGVEVFANDSPLPPLERALYRSLDETVSNMVSAELRGPLEADVVVRGRILDYWRLAGVFGPRNRLQEAGINVEVVAWLHERDTGERLGREVRLRREVRYAVGVGRGEDEALELALRNLTQELVLDLFHPSNYAVDDEQDATEEFVEEGPETFLDTPPASPPVDG